MSVEITYSTLDQSKKYWGQDMMRRHFSGENSSDCEVCNLPINLHSYVAVDAFGFVVQCSIVPEER